MNVSQDVADAIETLFHAQVLESIEEGDEPGKVKVTVCKDFMMAMIRLRLVAGMEVEPGMAAACYDHFARIGKTKELEAAGLVNGEFVVPPERIDPPLREDLANASGPMPGFTPGSTLGVLHDDPEPKKSILD